MHRPIQNSQSLSIKLAEWLPHRSTLTGLKIYSSNLTKNPLGGKAVKFVKAHLHIHFPELSMEHNCRRIRIFSVWVMYCPSFRKSLRYDQYKWRCLPKSVTQQKISFFPHFNFISHSIKWKFSREYRYKVIELLRGINLKYR